MSALPAHVSEKSKAGAPAPSNSPAVPAPAVITIAPAATASRGTGGVELHVEVSSLPARLSTRGEAVAITIYRFLETRSRADLDHVFAAVVATGVSLGGGLTTTGSAGDGPAGDEPAARIQFAKASLAAASVALGVTPSRREYDRWRSQQPCLDEFASATFIRRVFGNSWTEAVSQVCDGPQADFATRRLLRNGLAFTDAERERALRLFVEAVPPGKRTQARYRRWAREHLRQPGAFDVPRKPRILTRGSGVDWSELLRSVATIEQGADGSPAARGPHRHRPLPRGRLLECLRQSAANLGVHAPTTNEFNRWCAVAADTSGSRVSPDASGIIKRFGSWSAALFEAGLIDDEQLARYRRCAALRASAGSDSRPLP